MKKYLYDIFADKWIKPTGGTVWIFSDPHFSDLEAYRFKKIIKIPDKKDYFSKFKDGDIFETYETHIKKLVEKADKEQIKKINSKVGKNDTIIFLGDVGNLECIKDIKGYKVLILGNHDKGASNYKRRIEPEIIISNGISKDYDLYTDNHLFDEVYEGPLMINDRVILSHEPVAVPEYMYNVHGHVHNKHFKGDDHHLNCCAEAIDNTPVNLLKLIKEGLLKNIPNIHKPTIAGAVERKKAKETKNNVK